MCGVTDLSLRGAVYCCRKYICNSFDRQRALSSPSSLSAVTMYGYKTTGVFVACQLPVEQCYGCQRFSLHVPTRTHGCCKTDVEMMEISTSILQFVLQHHLHHSHTNCCMVANTMVR
jgi:hypothetical protein